MKRRKRCSNCKQVKDNVSKGPNPYKQDIENDDTPEWLCEECRNQLAEEV